jgi:hypothetical protein
MEQPSTHTAAPSLGSGGEGGQEGCLSRGKDNMGRNKNMTAKGRGSSTNVRKMEDYYTKAPRKKRKDEEDS